MFRPVTITAVLNGWIVTCGCQTVVCQERNQLVSDLDAYLKDPDATEARFLKSGVNQRHTGGLGALGDAGETVRVAPPPQYYDREPRNAESPAATQQTAGSRPWPSEL